MQINNWNILERMPRQFDDLVRITDARRRH